MNMSQQLKRALFIPSILTFLIVLAFVFEKGMGWDLYFLGIFPGNPKTLGGVVGMLFVHEGWSHLLNNIVSLFLLSLCLFYFYPSIAPKVMLWSVIIGGMLLWLIGRDNWHVGASGLVYSLAFFLFFSGIIRKHVPLMAISMVVIFVYGSMIWFMFPWQQTVSISWEGHLSGGITGFALSLIYRKFGPQKPELIDDDTEIELNENADENWYNN